MSTAGSNPKCRPLIGTTWPIQSRAIPLAAPAARLPTGCGAESTKLRAGVHEDRGRSCPPADDTSAGLCRPREVTS